LPEAARRLFTVNNWDKIDVESLPDDLIKYGHIKYAIKQSVAELNFLNKQVVRHEMWIKNTTEMMFVGIDKKKSGTGLILHHGDALETIASPTSKILDLILGTTPTNHKR